MPFTVKQLKEGHQELITLKSQETAKKALERMIEHDFSQLPVVDENDKPLGIVTSDSILRALNNFNVSLAELQVLNAIVEVDKYSQEEDLFDLLDDLKDTYAALITDNNGILTGIITSYDTTEYFRRRAEDMMFVEDIESTLKDFIQTAFGNGKDDAEKKALADIIEKISDNGLQKKFETALAHYLGQHDKNNAGIDRNVADTVFLKHFVGKAGTKTFDDLTLNEYIQLLLHKSKWPSFSSVFSLKVEAVSTLLHGVRITRNALAHFHGEISPQERDQLHFCADWLERHRSKVLEAFSPTNTNIATDFSKSITHPVKDLISSNTQVTTPNTQFVDQASPSETTQSTIHEQFTDEANPSDDFTHSSTLVDVSPLDETILPDDIWWPALSRHKSRRR